MTLSQLNWFQFKGTCLLGKSFRLRMVPQRDVCHCSQFQHPLPSVSDSGRQVVWSLGSHSWCSCCDSLRWEWRETDRGPLCRLSRPPNHLRLSCRPWQWPQWCRPDQWDRQGQGLQLVCSPCRIELPPRAGSKIASYKQQDCLIIESVESLLNWRFGN